MKASITISGLILVIAAAIGWMDHRRHSAALDEHRQLLHEVTKLGLNPDVSFSNRTARPHRKEREDPDETARQILAAFIDHGREFETVSGNETYPGLRHLEDAIASLDTLYIELVLRELLSNTELKPKTRRLFVDNILLALAVDRPRAVLSLYTGNFDLPEPADTHRFFEESITSERIIETSLGNLAKSDPQAALNWFKQQSNRTPKLPLASSKIRIVTGAAINDPKAAFRLLGELNLNTSSATLGQICRTAQTPEQRDRVLNALRDYLKTIPDQEARQKANQTGIDSLARSAVRDGFHSASQWFESANFTADELESIVRSRFHSEVQSHETGQWIDWLAKNLPAEKSDSIAPLFATWTHSDHAAAGQWLATAPEGPVKSTAIQTFAETVSPYQPETAAEWAETLPPGEPRDTTLKTIYQNWPKEDPASAAAAEAFAKKHGLK